MHEVELRDQIRPWLLLQRVEPLHAHIGREPGFGRTLRGVDVEAVAFCSRGQMTREVGEPSPFGGRPSVSALARSLSLWDVWLWLSGMQIIPCACADVGDFGVAVWELDAWVDEVADFAAPEVVLEI